MNTSMFSYDKELEELKALGWSHSTPEGRTMIHKVKKLLDGIMGFDSRRRIIVQYDYEIYRFTQSDLKKKHFTLFFSEKEVNEFYKSSEGYSILFEKMIETAREKGSISSKQIEVMENKLYFLK